ncbi:DUF6711 family protein [Paenibacillus alvei]|uniref:DUF6711 family protein n=1 Tax=Paenibacillus alvei TaxID=44250 RepID=UPI0018CED21C|nr:DUF6711 family protein [Paenibacillus alvei]MBG9737087.1 hypothetical protein [Paenibacillus alvei]MBG9742803.1 hypothetical protein [Paenibacillus alvei]MBG9746180.1 hypothetical protein [Paenibacillus alvei]MCY9579712.1 hypothetical protein [Paenibacillus alvei]MCY9586365.1 hypothetical protein [Paenibacillus alvei]
MKILIDGQEIAAYPSTFQVTILDIDDGNSSVRTANGTLNRDRVAVKRQIDMTWGVLSEKQISSILKAMSNVFFDFTFPDPMAGGSLTKKMYVGNRPAPFSVISNGVVHWNGLKLTLTER